MSNNILRKMMFSLVFVGAFCLIGSAMAADVIKIGASAAKTGPIAGGAAVTHWPNIQLWVQQVNARGGLQLKSGKAKIELVEYDDRTTPGEAIKNVQRMATQDKVDFILPPYGTAQSLASAPIFAKFGYPQLNATSITDKIPELTKRYPNIFFLLGTTTAFAEHVVKIYKSMKDKGQIGSRVAMVNVADAFGIELANAARPVFKEKGFQIVYDKSYPLGAKDLSPVIKGAKASNPDAFAAWSYPGDTLGLTEQAKIERLNVKAYYSAVATAFPIFVKKFGPFAEGILGAGGINPDTPEMKAYTKIHKEITGKIPDYWASAVTYAAFQVLEKAIEGVGTKDRKAVTDYIKNNSFDTVFGRIKFKDQNNAEFWTVGQWQDGVFYGVSSTGRPGAKPVRIKTSW